MLRGLSVPPQPIVAYYTYYQDPFCTANGAGCVTEGVARRSVACGRCVEWGGVVLEGVWW